MSEVKLTIDEVIAHCERKVDSYKSTNIEEIIEEYGLEKNFIKEYLEHKQVAEWLKELKQLRGAMERIIEQLEQNLEECKKYIREYDDSLSQKAFHQGILESLRVVKEEGGIE